MTFGYNFSLHSTPGQANESAVRDYLSTDLDGAMTVPNKYLVDEIFEKCALPFDADEDDILEILNRIREEYDNR